MHVQHFTHAWLLQVSLVAAAIANYLLGVVYYLTGLPLNFFPALFAALVIALALHSLFAVSMLSTCITTTIMHDGWMPGATSSSYL